MRGMSGKSMTGFSVGSWLALVTVLIIPSLTEAKKTPDDINQAHAIESILVERETCLKNDWDANLSFVVIHFSGEGAHYISSIMQKLDCLRFDPRESFDKRICCKRFDQAKPLSRWFNASKGNFPRCQTIFGEDRKESCHNLNMQYGYSRRSIQYINNSFDEYAKIKNDQFAAACPCEIRGALVRMQPELICKLKLRPLFIIRSNLLRYSLSNYDPKEHDQFLNKKTPKLKYDLPTLHQKVIGMLSRWGKMLTSYYQTKSCGVDPLFVVYEKWQIDPIGELERIRADFQKCANCPIRQINDDHDRLGSMEHLHKVHSDNISEFVENAQEVTDWFESMRFPSFEEFQSEFLAHWSAGVHTERLRKFSRTGKS